MTKVHEPKYTILRECGACGGKGWQLAPSGFYAGEPIKCASCAGEPVIVECRDSGNRPRRIVGFEARQLIQSGKARA